MKNLYVCFFSVVCFGCSAIVDGVSEEETVSFEDSSSLEETSDSETGEQSSDTDSLSVDVNPTDTSSNSESEDGTNTVSEIESSDSSTGSDMQDLCEGVDSNVYAISSYGGIRQYDLGKNELLDSGFDNCLISEYCSDIYNSVAFSLNMDSFYTMTSAEIIGFNFFGLYSVDFVDGFPFEKLGMTYETEGISDFVNAELVTYYGNGGEDFLVYTGADFRNGEQSYKASVYSSEDYSLLHTCSGTKGMHFWSGVSGKTYYLQYSTELSGDGTYTNIKDVFVGEFNMNLCSKITEISVPKMFMQRDFLSGFMVKDGKFWISASWELYVVNSKGEIEAKRILPESNWSIRTSPCFS